MAILTCCCFDEPTPCDGPRLISYHQQEGWYSKVSCTLYRQLRTYITRSDGTFYNYTQTMGEFREQVVVSDESYTPGAQGMTESCPASGPATESRFEGLDYSFSQSSGYMEYLRRCVFAGTNTTYEFYNVRHEFSLPYTRADMEAALQLIFLSYPWTFIDDRLGEFDGSGSGGITYDPIPFEPAAYGRVPCQSGLPVSNFIVPKAGYAIWREDPRDGCHFFLGPDPSLITALDCMQMMGAHYSVKVQVPRGTYRKKKKELGYFNNDNCQPPHIREFNCDTAYNPPTEHTSSTGNYAIVTPEGVDNHIIEVECYQ